MRSIYFVLFFGLLNPLPAQNSLDHSAAIHPSQAPDAEAVDDTENHHTAAVSAPGAQPAARPIQPSLDRFTVSPATLRETLTYREGVHTTIRLSAPALKTLVCRVTSSDANRLVCSSITFQKGEQERKGDIKVNWKEVPEDGQITLKAWDPDHPELVLRSRVYLRVSPHHASP